MSSHDIWQLHAVTTESRIVIGTIIRMLSIPDSTEKGAITDHKGIGQAMAVRLIGAP